MIPSVQGSESMADLPSIPTTTEAIRLRVKSSCRLDRKSIVAPSSTTMSMSTAQAFSPSSQTPVEKVALRRGAGLRPKATRSCSSTKRSSLRSTTTSMSAAMEMRFASLPPRSPSRRRSFRPTWSSVAVRLPATTMPRSAGPSSRDSKTALRNFSTR